MQPFLSHHFSPFALNIKGRRRREWHSSATLTTKQLQRPRRDKEGGEKLLWQKTRWKKTWLFRLFAVVRGGRKRGKKRVSLSLSLSLSSIISRLWEWDQHIWSYFFFGALKREFPVVKNPWRWRYRLFFRTLSGNNVQFLPILAKSWELFRTLWAVLRPRTLQHEMRRKEFLVTVKGGKTPLG